MIIEIETHETSLVLLALILATGHPSLENHEQNLLKILHKKIFESLPDQAHGN
jgi:hypothetical protein